MNRLSLAVLTLALASIAYSEKVTVTASKTFPWKVEAVPHRCDLDWLVALEKGINSNNVKGIPNFNDRVEDVGFNGKKYLIKAGAADVCDKEIWDYVARVKSLSDAAGADIKKQIAALRAVDEVYSHLDQSAMAALAGAQYVYDQAKTLKVGEWTQAKIGGGRANAVIPNSAFKPGKAEARALSGDDKALQARLVVASADGPEAGPLVQDVLENIKLWYVKLATHASQDDIIKKHKLTGTKNLDLSFPFGTMTNKDHESLKAMSTIIKGMTGVEGNVDPAADLPASALNKVDKKQRAAVALAIQNLRSVVAVAAALKDKPAEKEPPKEPAPGGVATVTSDMEAKIKAKAVEDANLAAWFDGQTPSKPADLPPNADQAAKQKHAEQLSAWEKYQNIMGGGLATVEMGGKKTTEFRLKDGRSVPIAEGASSDSIGSKVAQLILNKDMKAGEGAALVESILPGDAPLSGGLKADGVLGPSAATGKKSDGCDDKKSIDQYKKDLAAEKKKKSASRSADRREAQSDFKEALQDIEKDFEKCAYYPGKTGTGERIPKPAAEFKKCEEARDKAKAEARAEYAEAIGKLGTADEQTEEDGQVDKTVADEATAKHRAYLMQVISTTQGNWIAVPDNAKGHIKAEGSRAWMYENQDKARRVVRSFFGSQFPRGKDATKSDPKNPTYETNLKAAMAAVPYVENASDDVKAFLGKLLNEFVETQAGSAVKGGPKAAAGVSEADEMRRIECQELKKKGKKLPGDCEKLLGGK